MQLPKCNLRGLLTAFVFGSLLGQVAADDVLKTDGYSKCAENPTIDVQELNIKFDRTTQTVTFKVAGISKVVQNVTANLIVYAYGNQVYQRGFNPCSQNNFVEQLCPVPAGDFAASGTQTIPQAYIDKIPSIAYSIPDLDGQARLELDDVNTGKQVACIQTVVSNDKTAQVKGVSYAAAGMAGASLIVSGVASFAGAGHVAGAALSLNAFDVVGWFQSMSMNGMLSVQYPSIYQSFSRNFAWSTGLVGWRDMQVSIDRFRKATGGNLTHDSVPYLEHSTLVYQGSTKSDLGARGLQTLFEKVARQVSASVNGTTVTGQNGTSQGNSTRPHPQSMNFVHGIQGYVEQLAIPQANTFMTVLLVFAIVLGGIIVGILLFKVILEFWALFGSFPKKLTGFRKRYWWLLAKTITNLIFVLYGVWTLYCIYQFTNGDSWAAKALAGGTLGVFTLLLIAFTLKIYQKVRQGKKLSGDASALFEDKEIWVRYSIFYDTYKKSYWWLFVPLIIYMFARGCVIAGFDGNGMYQCGGQLIVESVFLILLLWTRPYTLKSGNWIHIIIHVVRVLSVICILIFVEELGFSSTTKTITGLVLVVVQSVLTALLAILIAVNFLIVMCRTNPHRKKRKEAAKLGMPYEDFPPVETRDLSIGATDKGGIVIKTDSIPMHTRNRSLGHFRDDSRANLVRYDTVNHSRSSSSTRMSYREPQLPKIEPRGFAL